MVCRSAGAAPRRGPRSPAVSRFQAVQALWLCALSACEPAREVSTWPLALRQVSSCRVGTPSQLELVALGDFPSRSFLLRGDEREPAIDDVPLDVRELLVRATTPVGVAEGRRVRVDLPGRSSVDPEALWLLQSGPSCPLADDGLRVRDGTALAALADGGALLVGGFETATVASSQALLLMAGQELAVDVEGGMLLRRAAASATALRDVVLVAGGTPDRRAGAHDNYELFELQTRRFVAARSGKLTEPRMQHAAVLMPDDKVLLIGGREEPDGEPLASLELVDVHTGASDRLAGALQVPRVSPTALRLDSGSVLVLGGEDGAGQLVGSVEVFDADAAAFVLAEGEVPVHEQACAAALPGARAAWLSCDHAPSGGGARCELALLRELERELQITPVALPFAEHVPKGLTDLRLIYTGAGQLLWTGADDSDPTGRRRAFLIDVASERLERVEASRVPTQLLRLQDDVIAELDGAGTSVRAAFTRGRYASPDGDLLQDASHNLVRDAPGHWREHADGMEALVAGARIDLGELRFAGFRAELNVQGDYALRLYDGLGHHTQVSVRSSALELPGCRYQLRADTVLQLTRVGTRLAISGAACSLAVPGEALGMALLLETGAVVRGIAIRRM